MTDYKEFETERLLLKPTSVADAEFLLELMNTPKWIANIGDRKVSSVESARDYISVRMLPQLERLGFCNFTIIRKTDNVKIGSCGLYDKEDLEEIDIGFALLPQYERKGYAFEAAETIKNAAFNTFGLNVICAITTKTNSSSQKLLEKIGLEFTGITKIPNDEEELFLYKMEKR